MPEYWGVEIFRSGLEFPKYPVVGVSWSFAKEYAEWAGKRLPTEAEWEFAARGGLIDKDFPTGNDWNVPLRRNTPGKGWKNLIVEVKSYDSNAYGLYNMSCNVWEWVEDCWHKNYEGHPRMVALGPAAESVIAVCCAAARGSTSLSGRVRRPASRTSVTTASTIAVFVSPRTFNPLFFLLFPFLYQRAMLADWRGLYSGITKIGYVVQYETSILWDVYASL